MYIRAVRRALPVLISLAGKSGSGKTYSALLMARGLVGPEGKIFVIDTEKGRASMYADDPDIGGYYVQELHPPFTADRFIEAIQEAQKEGADSIIIDSVTHEWSGIGGAQEQAFNMDPTGKKGPTAWIKPKMSHKRLMNHLTQSNCHVLCCLRADHKMIAYVDDNGKQQFCESPELVPEQEKKFIYEMTISATIDHDSHVAKFTKLPKPLVGALADKMIDATTGKVVSDWVQGGEAVDLELEGAKAELRDVAALGIKALEKHWYSLNNNLRKRLQPFLAEFKQIAAAADGIASSGETPQQEKDDNPLAGDPASPTYTVFDLMGRQVSVHRAADAFQSAFFNQMKQCETADTIDAFVKFNWPAFSALDDDRRTAILLEVEAYRTDLEADHAKDGIVPNREDERPPQEGRVPENEEDAPVFQGELEPGTEAESEVGSDLSEDAANIQADEIWNAALKKIPDPDVSKIEDFEFAWEAFIEARIEQILELGTEHAKGRAKHLKDTFDGCLREVRGES